MRSNVTKVSCSGFLLGLFILLTSDNVLRGADSFSAQPGSVVDVNAVDRSPSQLVSGLAVQEMRCDGTHIEFVSRLPIGSLIRRLAVIEQTTNWIVRCNSTNNPTKEDGGEFYYETNRTIIVAGSTVRQVLRVELNEEDVKCLLSSMLSDLVCTNLFNRVDVVGKLITEASGTRH